jgi:hypothetical protein
MSYSDAERIIRVKARPLSYSPIWSSFLSGDPLDKNLEEAHQRCGPAGLLYDLLMVCRSMGSTANGELFDFLLWEPVDNDARDLLHTPRYKIVYDWLHADELGFPVNYDCLFNLLCSFLVHYKFG